MRRTDAGAGVDVAQEGRRRAAAGAEGRLSVVVVLVVEPGERPPGREPRDGRPLPVRRPATHGVVAGKLDHRQAGQADGGADALVRLVLPGGGPDQFEPGLLGESQQRRAVRRVQPHPQALEPLGVATGVPAGRRAAIGDVTGGPSGRPRRVRVQRAVDVDEQQAAGHRCLVSSVGYEEIVRKGRVVRQRSSGPGADIGVVKRYRAGLSATDRRGTGDHAAADFRGAVGRPQ